jgi:hypothetical protein
MITYEAFLGSVERMWKLWNRSTDGVWKKEE